MSYPEVSGVSPKEGLPGTKVTIRGQNLGTSKEDIKCKVILQQQLYCTEKLFFRSPPTAVTICGKDCTSSLEYFSTKKLICLTPNIGGAGEIIVTTQSGGRGKCTVKFIGLEPEPVLTIGKSNLLKPLFVFKFRFIK